jgi:hypothetical protein
MKNFIKAFLVSSLMSGSFIVAAMDSWHSQEDKENAFLYGITTPREFYEQQEAQKEAMASFALINVPKSQEERDAELAHRIDQEEQDEELARQFQAQAIISPAPFIPYEASLQEQIASQTWEYAKGENRPTLQKFIDIFPYLKGIPQNSDVHILDNYVFGAQKKINDLLAVGRLYDVDNGDLTLAAVGQQMVQFVNNNKDFFATFQYEETFLNSDKIIPILNSHFPNMDNEIKAISPEARELWSRAWTLALNLYNQGDETAIQIIFEQAVEGHLTRGGCIQGRIDRGFVGYVSLLTRAGVGANLF